MVKVFFNNSCNICRAEISHYKKHSDKKVEWIDVTNNEEAQKVTSKSYKELLRRMHVIQDGKVIDGAESFLIIWKNVPKYNFLYKIFKIKPLFFLLFLLVLVSLSKRVENLRVADDAACGAVRSPRGPDGTRGFAKTD